MSKLAIVVAMQEELHMVLAQLTQSHCQERAGMQFHTGTYLNRPVVVVVCGVGKVNAAACTQILISEFSATRIINIGVAGALQTHIQAGDLVIADSLVQHDIDVTSLGLPPGHMYRMEKMAYEADPHLLAIARQAARQLPQHRWHTGRIVTGDQFIACNDKIHWLATTFDAIACEMESASMAQVCYLNRVPFIAIRSISDNANHSAGLDFKQFLSIAVENASTLLHVMVPNC